jgi:uncharacterized membrane protein HdeD (DUF308 family)
MSHLGGERVVNAVRCAGWRRLEQRRGFARASSTAARLRRSWYLSGLRGVAALLASLLVLTRPEWYSVFGAYLLADGLLCSASMLFGAGSGRLPFLVGGAAGLIAGALTVYTPLQWLQLEFMPVAGWALIIGCTTLCAGITVLFHRQVIWWPPRSRARHECWWPLIAAGLAALAFAALLLLPPVERAGELKPLLGLFAATFGYLQLRGGLSLGASGPEVSPETSDRR